MANVPEDRDTDRGDPAPGDRDRFWVLVDTRRPPSAREPDRRRPPRRTLVVRDGDTVLLSIDVHPGSPLAAPFRIDQLSCPGATLVVRIASETTPCGPCVDDHLAAACADPAGLDAAAVFRAVRAGVERCAHLRLADPQHGAPEGDAPPESVPPRSAGSVRLAPPSGPHVPAGGTGAADSDIDVILII